MRVKIILLCSLVCHAWAKGEKTNLPKLSKEIQSLPALRPGSVGLKPSSGRRSNLPGKPHGGAEGVAPMAPPLEGATLAPINDQIFLNFIWTTALFDS